MNRTSPTITTPRNRAGKRVNRARNPMSDRRTKPLRELMLNTDSFDEYVASIPNHRNNFQYYIYLYPEEARPIYEAVQDGLIPEDCITSTQIMWFLAMQGIERLRNENNDNKQGGRK
jgi:hypothetical protein